MSIDREKEEIHMKTQEDAKRDQSNRSARGWERGERTYNGSSLKT